MARPIERIALVQVQVPFKDRPPGAAGENLLRESLLLSVETAEGVVGLGECSPADPAELPACWSELEAIAGRLLGRTLADPEAIGPMAEGFGPVRPPAAAAAETALWDLAGQQAHRSLAELLGASPLRIGLGVGGLLTMGLYPTVVDLMRAIEPHLAEGYRAVSVAIAPGRDLEFVGAVRQHFPELDLAVDAGGRLGPSTPTSSVGSTTTSTSGSSSRMPPSSSTPW